MASAKLVKALATGKVKLQKAPKITGEVLLVFNPIIDRDTGKKTQPKSISIGWKDVEPLRRSDVTMENLRHSNLESLVRRQAIRIL